MTKEILDIAASLFTGAIDRSINKALEQTKARAKEAIKVSVLVYFFTNVLTLSLLLGVAVVILYWESLPQVQIEVLVTIAVCYFVFAIASLGIIGWKLQSFKKIEKNQKPMNELPIKEILQLVDRFLDHRAEKNKTSQRIEKLEDSTRLLAEAMKDFIAQKNQASESQINNSVKN